MQRPQIRARAVDQFEYIPLPALRPAGALADIDSEGPESRPDPLLLRIIAHPYLGLEDHQVTRVAGETAPSLEPGRGPVVGAAVFERDDVELAVAG